MRRICFLSWLAKTPEAALKGIQKVVGDVLADMLANGESVPVAMAEKATAASSAFAFRRCFIEILR